MCRRQLRCCCTYLDIVARPPLCLSLFYFGRSYAHEAVQQRRTCTLYHVTTSLARPRLHERKSRRYWDAMVLGWNDSSAKILTSLFWWNASTETNDVECELSSRRIDTHIYPCRCVHRGTSQNSHPVPHRTVCILGQTSTTTLHELFSAAY